MSPRRRAVPVAAAATFCTILVLAPAASAHDLDHTPPSLPITGPASTAFNAGGDGAEWELVTSVVTGNPHTDLDVFTSGGDTHVSVGTLGTGANGGGQTILRLTEDGQLDPSFLASHPSAACTSDPSAMLGLQHDVEATPKGDVPYNVDWGDAVDRTADTQLLLDATDASGRCHDGGTLGVSDAPQGGIEIIDVTDPANPVEIGLTSHVGEAHTVNVDPSRPHIAYVVTSDSVGVDADGRRTNETSATNTLDGFEVMDLSSCMDFPEGTTVEDKRERCAPEVFRYRYEDVDMVLGHTTQTSVYGCHEVEVHPDDRLTCASGSATMLFDVSGMFASDADGVDRIQGDPLPCARRPSSSVADFTTGAMVVDCVVGQDGQDLRVQPWLAAGAPSVEGIEWLGSAHHMGRQATVDSAVRPAYPSTEDVDFAHESELTHSGDFVITSDERGGGILPGAASCAPGVDVPQGNGGLHAYAVDRLDTAHPASAEEAWEAYARTPDAADKAIFRAPIHTQAQATECTAHVFQQIPGQNRLFLGWYSQGTQVVDWVEHADGSFSWHHVGWFTPELANTWVSHVFDVRENPDGTFTYLGVAGDFNVGNGRSAIDIYRVTLPPPRQFAPGAAPDEPDAGGGADDRPECATDRPGRRPPHCADDGRPGRGQQAPGRSDDTPGRSGRGDGSTRQADASASTRRPAATPQVIDLRPAAARRAAAAPADPTPGLALAAGIGLLATGIARRRRGAG